MVETVNNMRKTKSELQIKYRQQNKQDRWQTIYRFLFFNFCLFSLIPSCPHISISPLNFLFHSLLP